MSLTHYGSFEAPEDRHQKNPSQLQKSPPTRSSGQNLFGLEANAWFRGKDQPVLQLWHFAADWEFPQIY